jgi:hypothetical protein
MKTNLSSRSVAAPTTSMPALPERRARSWSRSSADRPLTHVPWMSAQSAAELLMHWMGRALCRRFVNFSPHVYVTCVWVQRSSLRSALWAGDACRDILHRDELVEYALACVNATTHVLLHGPGGVVRDDTLAGKVMNRLEQGKSSIARAVAGDFEQSSSDRAVLWLSAESPGAFLREMTVCAQNVYLVSDLQVDVDRPDEAARQLVQWLVEQLQSSASLRHLLVVLDNAEEEGLAAADRYLGDMQRTVSGRARGRRVSFLLTSRDNLLSPDAVLLPVDLLLPSDAVDLLKVSPEEDTTNELQELAKRCHHWPLMLVLARGRRSGRRSTVAGLIAELAEPAGPLVADGLQLAQSCLGDLSDAAKELALVCSLLAADNMPSSLLRALAKPSTIEELRRRSVLTSTNRDASFNLHRIVHDALRREVWSGGRVWVIVSRALQCMSKIVYNELATAHDELRGAASHLESLCEFADDCLRQLPVDPQVRHGACFLLSQCLRTMCQWRRHCAQFQEVGTANPKLHCVSLCVHTE